jgi:hypothetical protein
MNPLPAPNLRMNVGTWCVPTCCLPAVAHFLHDVLPNEPWDPHFLGQHLETTYFDTTRFALRKARVKGTRYLTLRIRCYQTPNEEEFYAISAKTEAEKWRQEIPSDTAEMILAGQISQWPAHLLPAHLLARLQELTGDVGSLVPAITVCCRRYAVENSEDRYTLDVSVGTDTGKCLPFHVLEFKSIDPEATPPGALLGIDLRPVKLSKFLWATEV